MARRDDIELPVGEPMEQFKEMLTERLKRLTSKVKKMDNGNPQSIENSDDIGLRAKYHALQRLQSATAIELATL